jgi:chemotaxis protein MotA
MTIAAFIDPLPLACVVGSSFAVAWVQNGTTAALGGLAALRRELWFKVQDQADEAHRAVLRIEHVVESRGISCADRVKTARLTAMVRFWENVADCAPAMGMLGTVIGLILLFGNVSDAASIGRAMAVALLTTLYGLVLSNLIAGPIAQRLARIAGEQIGWEEDAARRLFAIGRREYADVAAAAAAAAQPSSAVEGVAAHHPVHPV